MATKKFTIPQAVSDALSTRLETDDIQLKHIDTVRVSGFGDVRLVSAHPTTRANSVESVTVDSSGVIRTRSELVKLIGRDVFVPTFELGRPTRVDRTPIQIDPLRNDWSLNKCETASETISVTIPPSGTAPKADVYLLADTTGSMSAVLESVAAASNAIISDPAFAGFDVAWGVGNYRDFPVDDGVHNSYAFAHQLSPSTSLPDATTAIGSWVAAEGSDTSEGQLFALDRVANESAIGWRADSKRIVVWIGDAPGHDPICASLTGLGFDITEATSTAALSAAAITVVAIGTNTGLAADLDGDPGASASDYTGLGCVPAGTAGQATRIAAATGGSYTSGLSPADVVAQLVGLIKTAISSVGNVHLTPTGQTAEFITSITPAGGYGPLPGDVEHVLTFEVAWRGSRACGREDQVFEGTIDVVADGVTVAAKPVRVTVPACRYHYPVTFICGEQRAGDTCRTVEPGHYATLVTIYNPSTCPVVIEKRFAPVSLKGDVVAREPMTRPAKPFAKIVLGPGEVTMDDCCALREAVGDLDSLIGVLDIVAGGPLEVTVTTTTASSEGEGDRKWYGAPGITARTVEPRMAP
jgi:hypothetical protein